MSQHSHSEPAPSFKALGLSDALAQSLSSLGYQEPTPIQRAAIPLLLDGRDVLGLAATGTGKTAAFALPLIQRLFEQGRAQQHPNMLVLAPTRELAFQLSEALSRYGTSYKLRVLSVVGGQSFTEQLRALKRGVDIVVATPGRAQDHLERGTLVLSQIKAVVLDEADEMLDMGFFDDIDRILSALPPEKQVALFSATLPPRVEDLTKRYMNQPARVAIEKKKQAEGEKPAVVEHVYYVPRALKQVALARILAADEPVSAVIFCRTRMDVDALYESLKNRGYRTEALHGGMSQDQRDRTMKRFRAAQTQLLIATDVAARGLDINHVSHVINFDIPESPETYVHRIGRTGRAGREGVAISFADPRGVRTVRMIERVTNRTLIPMTVPSAVQLRQAEAKKIRLTLSETIQGHSVLSEALTEQLELLSKDHSWQDIASAAISLLYGDREQPEDSIHIPSMIPPAEGERRGGGGGRGPSGGGGGRGRRSYGGGGGGERSYDGRAPRYGDKRSGSSEGRSSSGGGYRKDRSQGGGERSGGYRDTYASRSERGSHGDTRKPSRKS